ncbi:ATP-binding protein [Clostridium estertheticum]|nr:ATP-binding protein [Clostridium estertheticum]
MILYPCDLYNYSICRGVVNPAPEYEKIVTRIYRKMKRILDLATNYGFDKNIWHNYLVFLLITNENSFSITCEKVGESDGTVNHFAKNDFKIFKNLFDYDFSHIEQDLDIDCFTTISNYKAIVKKERMYNKNVSEKVQYISSCIENAKDEEEVFCIITGFYKDFGVGMFGLNKAFRVGHTNGKLEFYPISNMDDVMLDDLVGYKFQKEELVENTEAFVEGRTVNNVS